MDKEFEWKENPIYPGRHWMLYRYYPSHHELVGEVSYGFYGGCYRFVAYWHGTFQPKVGLANSLDDAKIAVEAILLNKPYQLSLFDRR